MDYLTGIKAELNNYFTGEKKVDTEQDKANVTQLLYYTYLETFFFSKEFQAIEAKIFRENLVKAKSIGVDIDTPFGFFSDSLLSAIWKYFEIPNAYTVTATEALIEEGANINFQDKNGDTIFHHMAVICEDFEISNIAENDEGCYVFYDGKLVKTLPKQFLQNKVLNLKLKNCRGETAFQVAIKKGNISSARYFQSKDSSDFNLEEAEAEFLNEKFKNTYLFQEMDEDSEAEADFLNEKLQNTCLLQEVDEDSEDFYSSPRDTLKQYFSGERKVETTKDSSKIMKAIGQIYNRTVKHFSPSCFQDEAIKTLVKDLTKAKEIGANLDAPCEDGNSLLQNIWQLSSRPWLYRMEAMEKLVKEGADINSQNQKGNSLLHEMVIILDINSRYRLFSVTEKNEEQEEALFKKFLSDKNLDLNLKNLEEKTPFQIAIEKGNYFAAEFFHEKSGSNLSFEEVESKFFSGENHNFFVCGLKIVKPLDSLTNTLQNWDLQ